jgi:hypothetical protein
MIVAIWTALLLAASPQATPEPAFCSVSREAPGAAEAGGMTDVERIQALVRRAEVVVRARAVEYRELPERRGSPPIYVRFEVLEHLHGSGAPADLWVWGGFAAHDDFNDHPAPYLYSRPDSRSGACYAYSYREGGEYLLLLRPDFVGALSPYWAASAPTNEQVRGASDPWVVWVREQLRAPRAPGT